MYVYMSIYVPIGVSHMTSCDVNPPPRQPKLSQKGPIVSFRFVQFGCGVGCSEVEQTQKDSFDMHLGMTPAGNTFKKHGEGESTLTHSPTTLHSTYLRESQTELCQDL